MGKIKVELKCNCPYGTIGQIVDMPEEVAKAYGSEYVVPVKAEKAQKAIENAPADKAIKKETIKNK